MNITKKLCYIILIVMVSFLISNLCIFIYCKAVDQHIYEEAFKYAPADIEYYTEKNSIASYYNEKENLYYCYYESGRVAILGPDKSVHLIKSIYTNYAFHYEDGVLKYIYYDVPVYGKMDMQRASREVTESDIKKYGSFLLSDP